MKPSVRVGRSPVVRKDDDCQGRWVSLRAFVEDKTIEELRRQAALDGTTLHTRFLQCFEDGLSDAIVGKDNWRE